MEIRRKHKMKKNKILSIAIIVGLTIVAITPATAFAENDPIKAKELDSKGNVTVEQGLTGEGKPTDPENPNVVLPEDPNKDVNTNPNKGAIAIEKTTNLNFGTVKTSANKVVQFASPVVYKVPVNPEKPEEGTKDVNRGHFVQWADIRAGGVYGYTVTAELAQQFTGTGENPTKLNSAQINFSNGEIRTQTDNDNTKPAVYQTGFSLTEGTGIGKNAVTVVTADKMNKEGKGRYTMAFGKSDVDSEKDTTGKSVQLEIPAKTASNMAVDTYTAIITWKIIAAP